MSDTLTAPTTVPEADTDTTEPDTVMTNDVSTDSLLLAVEDLTAAHDRHGAERSDPTSTQNSGGDDGENRDLNLPRA
jgi:hypothetical protein